MITLKEKILNKQPGIVFYGLTPPKINTEDEKIRRIANTQIERLTGMNLDGLVLYDIQDETSRTNSPRPFPFIPTVTPDDYCKTYLNPLPVQKIIYKSVGKFTSAEFKWWLDGAAADCDCVVLVGTPSKNQLPTLSLKDAYKIRQDSASSILLGGVTIPERHAAKGDEHLRLFDKMERGCSFFISQCVYSVNHTKNFLSDYYYSSVESNRELVPIIFTLTPCGSIRTLQFMEWLGIDIPRWLNNDLKHSNDILTRSVDICKNIAVELLEFSASKKMPIGFNVESVAIRKDEIDASIELLNDIIRMTKNHNNLERPI